MTIATQSRTAGPFECNGSTTVYPFTFKVFTASDVSVIFRNTASGDETKLVLDIDYTVALNSNQNANPGGSITINGPAYESGNTLTLTSELQYLQPTDLTNQGGFYPKVISDALDRLTIFAQQIRGLATRSLKFPISDGNLDATVPGKDQRKGKVLAFDSTTGLPIAGPASVDIANLQSQFENAVSFAGYIPSGSFSSGATLSQPNQILSDGSSYWRWDGAFEKVVTAGSSPTPTGVGGWVLISDVPLRDMINVKEFGAFGDGTTDDSAAIQAAIDFIEDNPFYNLDATKEGYGGTVFFPQGRYVATGLRISKFNIEFRGVAGASFLVNKQTTGRMLLAQWDDGTNTLGGVKFKDIEVRNTVDRADGAGELILLNKPVRSQFDRFVMTSSDFNSGSKVSKIADGIKIVAPFEVSGSVVVYGFIGIGMDIISGPQSDSFELEGIFMYNTVGLVGFRGAGGSGNNNFKFTGKFLGNQGGTYVSNSQDSYAETTVVSTAGNDLTVASATNMKVGRAVVVGRTNTLEIAIIKSIVGNTLTLDRPITLTAGETVLSGRFGIVTSEMRNPRFEGVQWEGCDVGLYATQGTTKVVVDGYVASSCAKPFVVNGQVRKFALNNGVAATAGTMANSVTWKLLTLLNIVDRYSYFYISDNPAEGSGYYTGTRDSLIDNRSGFLPFLEMDNRLDGKVFNAKNSSTAVMFEDNSFLSFSRTTTAKFTRTSWKEGTTDKWFNDFTRANGDLEWRLNGETVGSLSFSGVNGIPTLGDGVWDGIPTKIGTQYLWVDANTKLRVRNGAPTSDLDGKVVGAYEPNWNSDSKLAIGGYRLWFDTSGRLRVKNSEPTSETDGTIVGTQS